MKNLIFFLTLFSFGFSDAQKVNCSKFKEGNFVYEDLLGNKTTIVRTGDKQEEYSEGLGLVIKSKIVWKDNCAYELTYESFEGYPNDNSQRIGEIRYCQVLERKGKTYKVHARNGKSDPGSIYLITQVD